MKIIIKADTKIAWQILSGFHAGAKVKDQGWLEASEQLTLELLPEQYIAVRKLDE